MLSLRRCLLWSAVLVALAACTPTTLIKLDNEWAQTYRAKIDSQSAPDYLATISNYDDQLADLSTRAAAAGDKAFGKDASMAIGFYRVAALSAWKSGDRHENEVPTISEKGRAACEKLPQHAASQPRDCAVLMIVDYLALYDRVAREITAMKSRAQLTANRQIPADQWDASKKLLGSGASALAGVVKAKQETAALPLPAEYFGYVARNVKDMYCSLEGFGDLLSQSSTAPVMHDAVIHELQSLDQRLAQTEGSIIC